MDPKDAKVEGINFIDRALRNKTVFKRFLLLLIVAGIIIVPSIAAWKGCEINTSKGSLKVKTSAPKNLPSVR